MSISNTSSTKCGFALIVAVMFIAACNGGKESPVITLTNTPAQTTTTTTAPTTPASPPGIASCTTPAIGLTFAASRLSGVAPLAVFFDATATTATATTRPFHDIEYKWNFGDPAGSPVNGTTWTNGSRAGASSRNAATGPVAAHVFETPGTYTVALTAFDGTNTRV